MGVGSYVDVAFTMLPEFSDRTSLDGPKARRVPPEITPGHAEACSEGGGGTGRKAFVRTQISSLFAEWVPLPGEHGIMHSIFAFLPWRLGPLEEWP